MKNKSLFLFLLLTGCLRKRSPEDLLKSAEANYTEQNYKGAVQVLEQFDRNYPFHDGYLDALILLVHSKKKLGKVMFSTTSINERIVKLCDEIIAQNTTKAFINDIMTIRIESQYKLCIHDPKYSNKLFINTMGLITKYFDYVVNLYQITVHAKSKVSAMEEIIVKVRSMPRPIDSPNSLRLEEMLQIYKKCERYLTSKRKAIIKYYLDLGNTAAALEESRAVIQNTELLELKPELIKERVVILLNTYEEDLNTDRNNVG